MYILSLFSDLWFEFKGLFQKEDKQLNQQAKKLLTPEELEQVRKERIEREIAAELKRIKARKGKI